MRTFQDNSLRHSGADLTKLPALAHESAGCVRAGIIPHVIPPRAA